MGSRFDLHALNRARATISAMAKFMTSRLGDSRPSGRTTGMEQGGLQGYAARRS